MAKIKKIKAREILNCQGFPTLETEITLDNGITTKASVPSGSSVGSYESFELKDGDHNRYGGKGVLLAVSKVNEIIAPAICGMNPKDQVEIDKKMIDLDDTKNKSNLGANSILSVSIACAKAAAIDSKKELFIYLKKTFSFENPKMPIPIFNIFNGGRHADTNLDFQEFLFIPKKDKAVNMIKQGAEVFHHLKDELEQSGYDTDVGAEGGYAPDLDSSIEAIELIMAAALRAGYRPKDDFNLGVDVGSSTLFEKQTNRYVFSLDNAYFNSENLITLYENWLSQYPFIYLEDGLAEDDWQSWHKLTSNIGDRVMIVGDDLFSTNVSRLRIGIEKQAANSIIIKPNQIGTLTETVDCIKLAVRHNYKIIVSHRSGETNDDFISDLAVACGADYLKAGSLSRGERLAKYNRLMEIEEKM